MAQHERKPIALLFLKEYEQIYQEQIRDFMYYLNACERADIVSCIVCHIHTLSLHVFPDSVKPGFNQDILL